LLQIDYKTNSLEKACTQFKIAKKQYGERMAIILHQRINELRAAASIVELVKYSIGRCHSLEGNRRGEYAMDLIHPHRLVFKQVKDQIEVVQILNIENYH